MFEELGISFGTALIVLLALYFIVKWAVKNGIKEAYRDITGKVTIEDIEPEQIIDELGIDKEGKQINSNLQRKRSTKDNISTAFLGFSLEKSTGTCKFCDFLCANN